MLSNIRLRDKLDFERCENIDLIAGNDTALNTVKNELGPFEWLFSSSTFFRQKGQRSKVIHQKFDGEFFRLVSSTTEKNQTANRVRYNKT